jgi:hypothetical protein
VHRQGPSVDWRCTAANSVISSLEITGWKKEYAVSGFVSFQAYALSWGFAQRRMVFITGVSGQPVGKGQAVQE